jgi:hypothetical protein
MKKLLLLLLLPYFAIAQTSNGREFEVEAVKTTGSQTITTPVYIVTEGVDGTHGKTTATGFEKTANKQNSLTVDGSGVKFPTVDAVNTNLNLKANLASPALTGTPTAPTATAGTNTTQVATTAFVTGAVSTANANAVLLTGNQSSISGAKSWSANTQFPLNNGISLTNSSSNSTYGAGALLITNTGDGFGSSILNNSVGFGLGILNSSTGTAIQLQQSSNGRLIQLNNLGVGLGLSIANNSTGVGISIAGNSTGSNIISGQNSVGTGLNYVGQNNGTNTFTVDKLGVVTATAFKTTGGTVNQFVDGTGALQNKSIFQNAITGLTTNYLPKWNGSGFGNSNIFDDGTNVGIGTTTPPAKFTVQRTTSVGNNSFGALISLQDDRSDRVSTINVVRGVGNYDIGMSFSTTYETSGSGNAFERIRITPIGNVLINTTTDNGQGVIQANGNITASPATLSNQVVVKSQLDAVASSGTYTPVASALSGTTSVTFDPHTYTKIGNIVTVYGVSRPVGVVSNVGVNFNFTLPISRSLSTSRIIGSGHGTANVLNNAAKIESLSTTTTNITFIVPVSGIVPVNYSFQYDVTQ